MKKVHFNLGKKRTLEAREKMRLAKLKNPTKFWSGKKRPEVVTWLAQAIPDRIVWNKGKKLPQFSGENHPRWIVDRTKLVKSQQRNDSAYKEWRKSVQDRDGWKCKISNGSCLGKVVAHHILPWARFPELRYQINNGIMLCHYHHPRKRSEELELSPYFQDLVLKAN